MTHVAGRQAWSFLVAGEERQFQGNDGYEDVVEESYSYDSTVGNHRRVRTGDLVVVRDSREALGVGYIEELEVLPSQEKPRSRCPKAVAQERSALIRGNCQAADGVRKQRLGGGRTLSVRLSCASTD
jgi:hypothetical protein